MLGAYPAARVYSSMYRGAGLKGRQRGIGRLLRAVKSDHIIQVDGLKLYFNHKVSTCYIRLIAGYYNEPETHAFLTSVLDKLPADARVTFIDVGANIGELTVDLARHPKIERVEAFEPQPECARACAASVALNALDEKVRVRRVLLNSKAGPVNFSFNDDAPQTSGINRAGSGKAIHATTLDEQFNFTSPAILKIDVEGAELEVLRGGIQFISKARPLIVFEYNEDNRGVYTLDEVKETLGRDYRLFRLRGDGLLDGRLEKTWNVVAISKDSIFWPIGEQLLATDGEAG